MQYWVSSKVVHQLSNGDETVVGVAGAEQVVGADWVGLAELVVGGLGG